MERLIWLLILVGSCNLLFATAEWPVLPSFYVSPTGDGNCSFSSPCSFPQLLTALTSNYSYADIIFHNGTYTIGPTVFPLPFPGVAHPLPDPKVPLQGNLTFRTFSGESDVIFIITSSLNFTSLTYTRSCTSSFHGITFTSPLPSPSSSTPPTFPIVYFAIGTPIAVNGGNFSYQHCNFIQVELQFVSFTRSASPLIDIIHSNFEDFRFLIGLAERVFILNTTFIGTQYMNLYGSFFIHIRDSILKNATSTLSSFHIHINKTRIENCEIKGKPLTMLTSGEFKVFAIADSIVTSTLIRTESYLGYALTLIMERSHFLHSSTMIEGEAATTDSIFEECDLPISAVMMFVYINATRTQFIRCTGPVIYGHSTINYRNDLFLKIEQCSFINNTAFQAPAAIDMICDGANITDSVFSGNRPYDISISSNATIMIRDTIFDEFSDDMPTTPLNIALMDNCMNSMGTYLMGNISGVVQSGTGDAEFHTNYGTFYCSNFRFDGPTRTSASSLSSPRPTSSPNDPPPHGSHLEKGEILVLAIGIPAVIIVLVLSAIYISRRKKGGSSEDTLFEILKWGPPIIQNVEIGEKIGIGSYGEVYAGTWNGVKVALKTIPSDDKYVSATIREASVMMTLRHPNIVQFLGLYRQDGRYFVTTEYVDGGRLDRFLHKNPDLFTPPDLVRLARDAVAGMMLLEQKGIIHRDLAARNLLIDTTRHELTLKVADFGMARVNEVYKISNRNIPVKWSAPEVLMYDRHTNKSDVWSIGVVIWEIFSFGQVPFGTMSNQETTEYVMAGNRLVLPELPSPHLEPLKKLVARCWKEDPFERPSFKEIFHTLSNILASFPITKGPPSPLSSSSSSHTENFPHPPTFEWGVDIYPRAYHYEGITPDSSLSDTLPPSTSPAPPPPPSPPRSFTPPYLDPLIPRAYIYEPFPVSSSSSSSSSSSPRDTPIPPSDSPPSPHFTPPSLSLFRKAYEYELLQMGDVSSTSNDDTSDE